MASTFFRKFMPGLFRFSVALYVLAAFSVVANTVIPRPTGGGKWYTGVVANDNPNDAFWDSPSMDDPNGTVGTGCNVGHWLGGVKTWGELLAHCQNDGNVSNKPSDFKGPGKLDFYASAATAAKPVGWDFVATGDQIIDMTVEVAGWRTNNVLGYYTLNGAVRQYNATNVLYNGNVTAGSPAGSKTVALDPGTEFGFFLCQNAGTFAGCTASNTFFSGSPYTSTTYTPKGGKFALFSENPVHPTAGSNIVKYWVGVEDLKGYNSVEKIGDYNDLVFSATVALRPPPPPPISTAEAGVYWIWAADLTGVMLFAKFASRRLRLVRQEA